MHSIIIGWCWYVIVLKIKYNDDIRRVRFIEKGFIGLQKQIGEIYGIQQGTFTLKYKDDEGDLVTISSEEEFSESFKFIQNNILRLEIASLEEKKKKEREDAEENGKENAIEINLNMEAVHFNLSTI